MTDQRGSTPQSADQVGGGKGNPQKQFLQEAGDGAFIKFAFFAGFQFAGFWLMVLIAGAVLVAIVTFSATQFQVRLSNLVLNGGQLSVWKAEQFRELWAASLDALNAAKKTLAANQDAWTKGIPERNAARAAFEECTHQVRY